MYSIIHVISKGLFVQLIFIIRVCSFSTRFFLAMILTTSMKADATSHLLHSAMILTPKPAGKHLSSARLITLVISLNVSFTSSDPRKPHLISSRYRVETKLSSHVKDSAGFKDSMHRGLSTTTSYKEADTDDINMQLFCPKRYPLVLNVAPNLTSRQLTILKSSVAICKTNLAFECALAPLINWTSQSNPLYFITDSVI